MMSLRAKSDKAGPGLSAPKSKVKTSLHPGSKGKVLGKVSSLTKPTVSSANKRSATQIKKVAAVTKPSFSKPGYSLYDSTASESSEPFTKEAADILKGVENATDVVRQMVNCRKGRLVKHKVKTKRVKSSVSKIKRDHDILTNGTGGRESSDGSPKQTNRLPLFIPTADKDGSSPVSVKSSVPAFNQRLHSSTPDPERLLEQEPIQQRSEAVQTSSSLFAFAGTSAKNNYDKHYHSPTDGHLPGERNLPAPVPMLQNVPINAYAPIQTNAGIYPPNVSNYPNQFGHPFSHGFEQSRDVVYYTPDLLNSARIQVPSNSPRAQNMPPVPMETNTYVISNPASVSSSPNGQAGVRNVNEMPASMPQQGVNIAMENERAPLLLNVNLGKEGQSDISTDYVSLPSPTQVFGSAPQGPGTVTFSPRSGDSVGFTPRPSGSEGFIPDSGNTGQSARSASSFTNVIGPYQHSSANQIPRNLSGQFSTNQIAASVELNKNVQGQAIGNRLLINNNEYVNAAGNVIYNDPQRLTALDAARNSPILNHITSQPGVNYIHNTPHSMPAAGFSQMMSANTNNVPYSATQNHPQFRSQFYRTSNATSLPNVPMSNVRMPNIPVSNVLMPNVPVPHGSMPSVPVPNVPVTPTSGQYSGQHNWPSMVNPSQVQFQSPSMPSSRKEIEVKIKTLKLLIRELKSKWTVDEVDTAEMRQLTDDLEKTVNDIPVDSAEYTLDAEITKAIRPLRDENDMLKRELQLAMTGKLNMISSQQSATNDIEVLTLQISKTSLERQLREEKERNDGLNERVNDMQTQLDNMKAERHKMMLNMAEKDTERLKPKYVSQQAVTHLRTEVNLAHKQSEGMKLKVNAAEKENHILAITLGQRDTEIERLQELVQTMKASMSTMLQGHIHGNTDDTSSKSQGWMGAGMNLQKLDTLLREGKTMSMPQRSPTKSVHSDPGHENNNSASPSHTTYATGRTPLSSKDVFRLTRDNLARHDHGMGAQQGHGTKSDTKPAGILKGAANYDSDKVRDREVYSKMGAAGFASSSPIKSSMNGLVGKETLNDIVEELSEVTMTDTTFQRQDKKISAKMNPGLSPYKDNKTGLNSIREIRSDSLTDTRADNATDVTSVSRYSVTDYFKKYSGQQKNSELNNIQNVNEEMDVSAIQHLPSVYDSHTSPPFIKKPSPQITESQLKPVKTRSDTQILLPPPSASVPMSNTALPGNHDDNVSIVSGMTMNSISTAMTVDENVFRDGLANLDANIARIQENLQQTRDVYGVP